jgi:hypothetical protein
MRFVADCANNITRIRALSLLELFFIHITFYALDSTTYKWLGSTATNLHNDLIKPYKKLSVPEVHTLYQTLFNRV